MGKWSTDKKHDMVADPDWPSRNLTQARDSNSETQGACDRGVDDRDRRQGEREGLCFSLGACGVAAKEARCQCQCWARGQSVGRLELTVERLARMALVTNLQGGSLHIQRRKIQLDVVNLARASDGCQSDGESVPSVACTLLLFPVLLSRVRPPPPGAVGPIIGRTILPFTGVLLHTHQPTLCPPHSSYLEVFRLGKLNQARLRIARVVGGLCVPICWCPRPVPARGSHERHKPADMNPKTRFRKRIHGITGTTRGACNFRDSTVYKASNCLACTLMLRETRTHYGVPAWTTCFAHCTCEHTIYTVHVRVDTSTCPVPKRLTRLEYAWTQIRILCTKDAIVGCWPDICLAMSLQ